MLSSKRNLLNPRMYTQTYTSTVVQGKGRGEGKGGKGVVTKSPLGFAPGKYFNASS